MRGEKDEKKSRGSGSGDHLELGKFGGGQRINLVRSDLAASITMGRRGKGGVAVRGAMKSLVILFGEKQEEERELGGKEKTTTTTLR